MTTLRTFATISDLVIAYRNDTAALARLASRDGDRTDWLVGGEINPEVEEVLTRALENASAYIQDDLQGTGVDFADAQTIRSCRQMCETLALHSLHEHAGKAPADNPYRDKAEMVRQKLRDIRNRKSAIGSDAPQPQGAMYSSTSNSNRRYNPPPVNGSGEQDNSMDGWN